jgi:hypothetical protein
LNHSGPVSQLLNFLDNDPIFQTYDTSSGGGTTELPYSTAFQDGINQNGQIRQVSSHYYGSSGCPSNLPSIGLNHQGSVVHQLTPYVDVIDFLNTAGPQNQRIPYMFTEFAIGSAPNPGVQNNLGTALYNVDFMLYAMTIGVDSFYYSESLEEYFLLWLPQTSDGVPAQTYAPFYAFPFIADFIGNSGKTYASALTLPSSAPSTLIGYGAYVNNQIQRIAFINQQPWGTWTYNGTAQVPNTITNVGDPQTYSTVNLVSGVAGQSPRPAQPLVVSVPSGTNTVIIKFLNAGVSLIPSSNAKILTTQLGSWAEGFNVTYGGSQWTYASNGLEVPGVTQDTLTLTPMNGQISFNLPASSAALLFFN